MVFTYDVSGQGHSEGQSTGPADDELRDALDFFIAPDRDWAAELQAGNIGIAGHSMVCAVQTVGNDNRPEVKAISAWSDLGPGYTGSAPIQGQGADYDAWITPPVPRRWPRRSRQARRIRMRCARRRRRPGDRDRERHAPRVVARHVLLTPRRGARRSRSSTRSRGSTSTWSPTSAAPGWARPSGSSRTTNRARARGTACRGSTCPPIRSAASTAATSATARSTANSGPPLPAGSHDPPVAAVQEHVVAEHLVRPLVRVVVEGLPLYVTCRFPLRRLVVPSSSSAIRRPRPDGHPVKTGGHASAHSPSSASDSGRRSRRCRSPSARSPDGQSHRRTMILVPESSSLGVCGAGAGLDGFAPSESSSPHAASAMAAVARTKRIRMAT